MRQFAGWLIGALIRLWVRSLRVTLDVHPAARLGTGRAVFAFFHGHQMALLAARRPVCALVSHSRDGDIQTGVMRAMGFDVVRGSSSRGGGGALRALARRLVLMDAAFAVDGPRGPRAVAKPGAAAAARLAGAQLLPVASAASRCSVLARAWDRFEVPWPWSRVAIVVGEPVEPSESTQALTRAIFDARRSAEALVRSSGAVSS